MRSITSSNIVQRFALQDSQQRWTTRANQPTAGTRVTMPPHRRRSPGRGPIRCHQRPVMTSPTSSASQMITDIHHAASSECRCPEEVTRPSPPTLVVEELAAIIINGLQRRASARAGRSVQWRRYCRRTRCADQQDVGRRKMRSRASVTAQDALLRRFAAPTIFTANTARLVHQQQFAAVTSTSVDADQKKPALVEVFIQQHGVTGSRRNTAEDALDGRSCGCSMALAMRTPA